MGFDLLWLQFQNHFQQCFVLCFQAGKLSFIIVRSVPYSRPTNSLRLAAFLIQACSCWFVFPGSAQCRTMASALWILPPLDVKLMALILSLWEFSWPCSFQDLLWVSRCAIAWLPETRTSTTTVALPAPLSKFRVHVTSAKLWKRHCPLPETELSKFSKELLLRSRNTWTHAHMAKISILLDKGGKCGTNLVIAGISHKCQMVVWDHTGLVALALA